MVDRVALVVGKTVFTQSEVDDEARLSELEAGKPLVLDLSGVRRKLKRAERLVDQQLPAGGTDAQRIQAPQVDGDRFSAAFARNIFLRRRSTARR